MIPSPAIDLNTVVVGALLALTVVLAVVHLRRRRARQARGEAELADHQTRGGNLARSLHPVIDPDVCIGSLSCLKACPEGDILGVVDGAARLIHADHCIGHGRCAAECPVGAIRLVFGTAERGVDLPEVDGFFESSRPGVHVVGELGGMGLIKNAVGQGLQAADRLAATVPRGAPPVAIIGAGPAGIATAVGLRAHGIPFRLLEQASVGGSVMHYPRKKVVMTEPFELPGYGRVSSVRISKEELVATWNRVLQKTGVRVEAGVKVTGISGEDGRFVVETPKGSVAASKVVLAIGRRGTPRKLGVPGEDLAKVVYSLTEPEQYAGSRVLVVGGGDSALESVQLLALESDAEVTLSYRGAELTKCREENRRRVKELADSKRIRLFLGSEVRSIGAREVLLEKRGKTASFPNDFVIVNAGGELPLEFLSSVGVSMRKYHGEAPGEGGSSRVARAAALWEQQRAEERKRRARRLVLAVAGVVLLAYLAWEGRDYYPLPRVERLRHPLHPTHRPAGTWGHGIGIAATAFMLSNFLYAARKRWRRLARLGPIGRWLDFHVFVGFMSPLVIAFHSAFQSNNQLATGTAGALAIVVATGIIGRFIYGVVPSHESGAVELPDLLARFERLRDALGRLPDRASGAAGRLVARVTSPVKAGWLPVLFVRFPAESLALRLRLAGLRGSFADGAHHAEFRETVLRLEKLRWQIRFFGSLKRLMRGWRAFHATLAISLLFVIAAHIALSLYLGYGLLRR